MSQNSVFVRRFSYDLIPPAYVLYYCVELHLSLMLFVFLEFIVVNITYLVNELTYTLRNKLNSFIVTSEFPVVGMAVVVNWQESYIICSYVLIPVALWNFISLAQMVREVTHRRQSENQKCFLHDPMLLLKFYKKYTALKSCNIFSIIYCHAWCQDPLLSATSVTSSSEVRASAILWLPTVANWKVQVRCSLQRHKSVPHFTKIQSLFSPIKRRGQTGAFILCNEHKVILIWAQQASAKCPCYRKWRCCCMVGVN
jgi:hypothetical protein